MDVSSQGKVEHQGFNEILPKSVSQKDPLQEIKQRVTKAFESFRQTMKVTQSAMIVLSGGETQLSKKLGAAGTLGTAFLNLKQRLKAEKSEIEELNGRIAGTTDPTILKELSSALQKAKLREATLTQELASLDKALGNKDMQTFRKERAVIEKHLEKARDIEQETGLKTWFKDDPAKSYAASKVFDAQKAFASLRTQLEKAVKEDPELAKEMDGLREKIQAHTDALELGLSSAQKKIMEKIEDTGDELDKKTVEGWGCKQKDLVQVLSVLLAKGFAKGQFKAKGGELKYPIQIDSLVGVIKHENFTVQVGPMVSHYEEITNPNSKPKPPNLSLETPVSAPPNPRASRSYTNEAADQVSKDIGKPSTAYTDSITVHVGLLKGILDTGRVRTVANKINALSLRTRQMEHFVSKAGEKATEGDYAKVDSEGFKNLQQLINKTKDDLRAMEFKIAQVIANPKLKGSHTAEQIMPQVIFLKARLSELEARHAAIVNTFGPDVREVVKGQETITKMCRGKSIQRQNARIEGFYGALAEYDKIEKIASRQSNPTIDNQLRLAGKAIQGKYDDIIEIAKDKTKLKYHLLTILTPAICTPKVSSKDREQMLIELEHKRLTNPQEWNELIKLVGNEARYEAALNAFEQSAVKPIRTLVTLQHLTARLSKIATPPESEEQQLEIAGIMSKTQEVIRKLEEQGKAGYQEVKDAQVQLERVVALQTVAYCEDQIKELSDVEPGIEAAYQFHEVQEQIQHYRANYGSDETHLATAARLETELGRKDFVLDLPENLKQNMMKWTAKTPEKITVAPEEFETFKTVLACQIAQTLYTSRPTSMKELLSVVNSNPALKESVEKNRQLKYMLNSFESSGLKDLNSDFSEVIRSQKTVTVEVSRNSIVFNHSGFQELFKKGEERELTKTTAQQASQWLKFEEDLRAKMPTTTQMKDFIIEYTKLHGNADAFYQLLADMSKNGYEIAACTRDVFQGGKDSEFNKTWMKKSENAPIRSLWAKEKSVDGADINLHVTPFQRLSRIVMQANKMAEVFMNDSLKPLLKQKNSEINWDKRLKDFPTKFQEGDSRELVLIDIEKLLPDNESVKVLKDLLTQVPDKVGSYTRQVNEATKQKESIQALRDFFKGNRKDLIRLESVLSTVSSQSADKGTKESALKSFKRELTASIDKAQRALYQSPIPIKVQRKHQQMIENNLKIVKNMDDLAKSLELDVTDKGHESVQSRHESIKLLKEQISESILSPALTIVFNESLSKETRQKSLKDLQQGPSEAIETANKELSNAGGQEQLIKSTEGRATLGRLQTAIATHTKTIQAIDALANSFDLNIKGG